MARQRQIHSSEKEKTRTEEDDCHEWNGTAHALGGETDQNGIQQKEKRHRAVGLQRGRISDRGKNRENLHRQKQFQPETVCAARFGGNPRRDRGVLQPAGTAYSERPDAQSSGAHCRLCRFVCRQGDRSLSRQNPVLRRDGIPHSAQKAAQRGRQPGDRRPAGQ